MNQLHPTKWYWPCGTSGGEPCRWEGWVNFGIDGVRWITLDLVAA